MMRSTRELLVDRTIKLIAFDGISDDTLLKACQECGNVNDFCKFPNGIVEVLEELESSLDDLLRTQITYLENAKIREKVFNTTKSRILLYLNVPNYREFLRRELAFCLLPNNVCLLFKIFGRSVSNIWYCIDDKSTDFNYYTKRLSLGAIYISTLLYFVDDFSENFVDSFAFLQRRIDNVLQFHKFKSRVCNLFQKTGNLVVGNI